MPSDTSHNLKMRVVTDGEWLAKVTAADNLHRRTSAMMEDIRNARNSLHTNREKLFSKRDQLQCLNRKCFPHHQERPKRLERLGYDRSWIEYANDWQAFITIQDVKIQQWHDRPEVSMTFLQKQMVEAQTTHIEIGKNKANISQWRNHHQYRLQTGLDDGCYNNEEMAKCFYQWIDEVTAHIERLSAECIELFGEEAAEVTALLRTAESLYQRINHLHKIGDDKEIASLTGDFATSMTISAYPNTTNFHPAEGIDIKISRPKSNRSKQEAQRVKIMQQIELIKARKVVSDSRKEHHQTSQILSALALNTKATINSANINVSRRTRMDPRILRGMVPLCYEKTGSSTSPSTSSSPTPTPAIPTPQPSLATRRKRIDHRVLRGLHTRSCANDDSLMSSCQSASVNPY
ncbi:hypothetical protein HDU76_002614 [Blyttiomyces sp. JEL0837]|nr:hypothetical protein HDU76_002614 [Blyttiomyces sp. JEL0837]